MEELCRFLLAPATLHTPDLASPNLSKGPAQKHLNALAEYRIHYHENSKMPTLLLR